MNKIISQLQNNPKVRYVAVGGVVYIFELLVILIAEAMHTTQLIAVASSFWLGLLLSFALQKIITFNDMRTDRKIVIPQFAAICLLVLFNFGFTLLVVSLLEGKLPTTVSRTAALGTTTLWNFFIYRKYIFKNSRDALVD